MKIKGHLSIALFLLSVNCIAATEAPKTATSTITIAEKQWKLGSKDQNQNNSIQEYVVDNETIDHWSELFTHHKFKINFPKDITPLAFAENQLAELKSKGYQVQFTTHESSPQEVIVEYRILSPVNDQEDQIQRITKTASGEFITLHYAIRKGDMGDTERSKWVTTLKSVDANQFDS